MSLTVDPKLTVEMLRNGKLNGISAEREVNNLIAEVSSGIYTFDQMGLRNKRELEKLKKKRKIALCN